MKKSILAFSIVCASSAFAQKPEGSKLVVSCMSTIGEKLLVGGRTYSVYKVATEGQVKAGYYLETTNASIGPADVARGVEFRKENTTVVDQEGTLSITSDLGKSGYAVVHLKSNAKSFVDLNIFKSQVNTAGAHELTCGTF